MIKLRLLYMLSFLLLLQSCDKEEDNPDVIGFEEAILGSWKGQDYFAEYFNEDGELLFRENRRVFIKELKINEEHIIYRYMSGDPDWTSDYATQTREGKNYIIFYSPFPDIHVTELTENLMVWEETTNGGSYDDDMGNISMQADYTVRTFKFYR